MYIFQNLLNTTKVRLPFCTKSVPVSISNDCCHAGWGIDNQNCLKDTWGSLQRCTGKQGNLKLI